MRCHWADEKLVCWKMDPSVRSRLSPSENAPLVQLPGVVGAATGMARAARGPRRPAEEGPGGRSAARGGIPDAAAPRSGTPIRTSRDEMNVRIADPPEAPNPREGLFDVRTRPG